jgi:hypothetical protein
VKRHSHENTTSAEGDTRRALARPLDDGPDHLPEADAHGLSFLLVAAPLKPNKK